MVRRSAAQTLKRQFWAQAKHEITPNVTRLAQSGRYAFKGPVSAIILDWSGTTADAHVLAPAVTFKEVFEKYGVPITMQVARGPMGLRKDLHIKEILEMPDVAERWEKVHGRPLDIEADTLKMYADFIPMQLDVLKRYSAILPGCTEVLNQLQADGIKIGSTTGFNRAMVDVLLESAIEQGFTPDFSVAGDDVENNQGVRPGPFMLYKNLVNLGVYPIESVIKVDDTCGGVMEGINAGCWGIGVSDWSNYTDVDSWEQWEAMPEAERQERRDFAKNKLLNESGAHYVIDSIAHLPTVVEDINRRLSLGEKP